MTANDVRFVSYTGKSPQLCNGVLTLSIDGVEHTFGSITNGAEFCGIWSSGGHIFVEDNGVFETQGEWTSDWNEPGCEVLDRHFGDGFSKKLIEIMNENVEHGCCGWCR